MAKKSKSLQNKQQTTGEKVDLRYATIDELMGLETKREYTHESVEAYAQFINALDKDQLAHEALKRNLIPSITRVQLVAKLISQFRSKHFARPELLRKGEVRKQDQPDSLLTPIEKLSLTPKSRTK
jgi:DNA-binding transcriptional regulator YbjK